MKCYLRQAWLAVGIFLASCATTPPQSMPFNYLPEHDVIAKKVSSNWYAQQTEAVRPIHVRVNLGPDGHLVNIRIIKSSGDPSFDQSLLRAIRKSDPLPIPASKQELYQEFDMTFAPVGKSQ